MTKQPKGAPKCATAAALICTFHSAVHFYFISINFIRIDRISVRIHETAFIDFLVHSSFSLPFKPHVEQRRAE